MNYLKARLVNSKESTIYKYQNYIVSQKILLNLQLSDVIVGIQYDIEINGIKNFKDSKYFLSSKYIYFKNPFQNNDKTTVVKDRITYSRNEDVLTLSRKDGKIYTNDVDEAFYLYNEDKGIHVRLTVKHMDKYYTVILFIDTYKVITITDDDTPVIDILGKELMRMYPNYYTYMYLITYIKKEININLN